MKIDIGNTEEVEVVKKALMCAIAYTNTRCGFKWELKSAAREAYDRMTYLGGIKDLPPMVQDAYAILQEGLEHERKIRFHNEREGGDK